MNEQGDPIDRRISRTPPEEIDLTTVETFAEFPVGPLAPTPCPCCQQEPAMFVIKAGDVYFMIGAECTRFFYPSRRVGTITPKPGTITPQDGGQA